MTTLTTRYYIEIFRSTLRWKRDSTAYDSLNDPTFLSVYEAYKLHRGRGRVRVVEVTTTETVMNLND